MEMEPTRKGSEMDERTIGEMLEYGIPLDQAIEARRASITAKFFALLADESMSMIDTTEESEILANDIVSVKHYSQVERILEIYMRPDPAS
jgi:hypothetical protein